MLRAIAPQAMNLRSRVSVSNVSAAAAEAAAARHMEEASQGFEEIEQSTSVASAP